MRDSRLEIFEELADHAESLENVLVRLCELVSDLEMSINEDERLRAECRLFEFSSAVAGRIEETEIDNILCRLVHEMTPPEEIQ